MPMVIPAKVVHANVGGRLLDPKLIHPAIVPAEYPSRIPKQKPSKIHLLV
jgi:hypothetical protein